MTRDEADEILRDSSLVTFDHGRTVQLDGHFSIPELEALLVLMRTPDSTPELKKDDAMSEMKQLREEKVRLETHFSEAIETFEKRWGVFVKSIDLGRIDVRTVADEGRRSLLRVEMEVEL